jgi:HSP20 family molecular chaperone IbpA
MKVNMIYANSVDLSINDMFNYDPFTLPDWTPQRGGVIRRINTTPMSYNNEKPVNRFYSCVTADSYTMSLDVPGVKLEDLTVEIDKNVLVVSSRREVCLTSGKTIHSKSERLMMPTNVNHESAQADLTNGVLTVQFSLKQDQPQKIQVTQK